VTRSVHLRPWQKTALDQYLGSDAADFLAVATPGAGKTTFALTAARRYMAGRACRLIVVAPTAHLKGQWAEAAHRFDLHLDPRWNAADGAAAIDMHGLVTTYQQVATSAQWLARLAQGAFVILDEIHHAGDERAWGEAVLAAFGGAARRLSLSGTPFRSDTRAIPFVRYHADEARPDFEYSYGAALQDGRVVRPVFFPRTGGEMEWSAPDGSVQSATFTDVLDPTRANQRLRTALSLEGQWLPEVLTQANRQLLALRQDQPEAGGLVIAIDQEHAAGIAEHLRRNFRARVAVAVSDDPRASELIGRFRSSSEPWLVAVRMVSEGVDIPRLRVGVYATTTTTELFFRQAVGRLVRWTSGLRGQRSYLFIPDDWRLRAHAQQIADQRRHSLRRQEAAARTDVGSEERVPPEEQMSLFSVISAVATDPQVPEEDDWTWEAEPEAALVELDLGAPPPLAGGGPGPAGLEGAGTLSRRELKDRLRKANANLVADLVRQTGWSHAAVNAELNRLSGIKRITEATAADLERRLRHAERWSARTRGRPG
jgi:superfamily II DNA or RNA helicase